MNGFALAIAYLSVVLVIYLFVAFLGAYRGGRWYDHMLGTTLA